MGYIWLCVDEITTPDDYTVVFKLNQAQPLDLVAAANIGAFIYSPTAVQKNGEDWLNQGGDAGSGPYCIKSIQGGTQALLTRFADYWRGWDGNHISSAIVNYTPEATTRTELISAGKATYTSDIPIENLASLQKNPNVSIYVDTSWVDQLAEFNMASGKPLANQFLRQALSYAFPYKDVIEAMQGAYGTQGYGPIVNGLWGYDEEKATVPQYTYDLEKAKTLLQQAGYKPGELTLTVLNNSDSESTMKMAQLMKASYAQIGVNLEMRNMPMQQFLEAARNSPDSYDIVTAKWWPTWPTPYDALYNKWHSQDPVLWNWNNWSDPQTDQLMDQANELQATDKEGAIKLFVQAAKIGVEQARDVWACDNQMVSLTSSKLKGFTGIDPAYPYEVYFYNVWIEK